MTTTRRLILVLLLALLAIQWMPVSAATPTPDEQVTQLQDELADLTRAYGRKVEEAKLLRKQRNEARKEVESLQATVDALQTQIAEIPTAVPTAAPTQVPTPKPTVQTEPTGCATSAEQQYFNDATEIVADFYANYQQLVSELQSSTPDLTIITGLMAQFPSYYQRYLALDVPTKRLQNVHDHALATLYHMNQATYYYGEWLDSGSDGNLQSTVDEITASGDEADRAATAIANVQSELCLD